jgi:hypothetical protein
VDRDLQVGGVARHGDERPVLTAAEGHVHLAPDGTTVAYAQPKQSSTSNGSPRLTDVLVADAQSSLPVTIFTIAAANTGSTSADSPSNDVEEVHDLTWTPDGRAADGTWVAFLTDAATGSGGSAFLALCGYN